LRLLSSRLPVALTCLALTLSSSRAQTPAADSAALAKYDANKNGRLDPDELRLMQADAERGSDTVQLNPFEVQSDSNGYYAANTMSGTRFNSKLEDLASSVTVVTKEQMSDFAMLDINDIFAYTGNTEGTKTYTDTVIDRNGSVSDNVQLNPQGANRVRSIAPANISFNNIETMGRVPLDPIALDAVEISRGPNANVFGLGNPSGTVNQVAASANLTRDRSQVQFRGDSYGGYRSSIDLNRVLFKGKLAIRGSAVFQHDGFQLKPSGVNTERYNGMVKYRPFKNTTISASVSYYRMNGNRPNSLTPRDNITYWLKNGSPTWDPTTQQIHINGATVGTFTSTTYNGPDYFSATLLGGNHSQMFIDQNGLSYWSAPQTFLNTAALLPGTTVAGPTSGGQAVRFLQTTGIAGATGTAVKPSAQPLFVTSPAINNRALYDWTSTNISAPNRLIDRTITSYAEINQTLLNSEMQTLVLQGAVLREDSQRYQRNLIGIANDLGQSGQVEIDPNEKLLDGSPNPYFLRPFIATDKPRIVYAPAKWDTYRAQAAYKIDFTRQKSLLKWLGLQELTAYDEYKYRINRQYSFRDAMLDNKAWITPGTYRGAQAQIAGTPTLVPLTQGLYRYYLGDNKGNNVEYAPQEFNNNGTYNFVWGASTAAGTPVTFRSEPTQLGLAATPDSSGGASNSKKILKTLGGVIQSHLINDALVVTLGRREDKLYSRSGNLNAAVINSDGTTFNYPLINSWDVNESENGGITTTVQYAVRPFRDIPFLARMEQEGGASKFVASALRGFSFYYNNSDSFLPQGPAQDLYMKALPNTTGKDKSIGFGLNLFDGKFVVRVTHYDTQQIAIRNGDANTVNGRVLRIDLPYQSSSSTKFQLYEVAGGTTASWGPNNNQFGWIKAANPALTDSQVFDEFVKQSGLSAATINAFSGNSINPPIAASNDVAARGTEVELNFNPNRFWTVSANMSDTKAYVKNVSSTLQKWIDQRMPIWTSLVDQAADINWTAAQLAAEPQHLWWTHNYGGSQTAQQNFVSFVQTPYSVIKQLEGQANPQTARWAAKLSTNFKVAGISQNHILRNFNVGGAVRWQSRAAIGFYGVADANGIYQTIDTKRPIWGTDHYYFDALVAYRTKIWSDRIGATFQVNAQNIFEGEGRLQAVGAYPDGTPNNFRIIDPRQFIVSAIFDF
jgi:outer membrane receptor for ferric coprogen and ferric-rhodotorulic acid